MIGRRCMWNLNEPIKCFQTPFEYEKPLIDGEKVVLRVCKYENVYEKMIK